MTVAPIGRIGRYLLTDSDSDALFTPCWEYRPEDICLNKLLQLNLPKYKNCKRIFRNTTKHTWKLYFGSPTVKILIIIERAATPMGICSKQKTSYSVKQPQAWHNLLVNRASFY